MCVYVGVCVHTYGYILKQEVPEDLFLVGPQDPAPQL